MRRALLVGALLLPTALAVVLVRPAGAQTQVYGSYGLTGLAAGVRTAGDVGVSGGLVTLDTGSGQVAARLDSSPSAGVLAAPYEPGTLSRTVAGQVNAGAGEQVLDVPDAEAAFPGTGSGAVGAVPPSEGGPVSGEGGSAAATADARSARGSSTGSRLEVEDALVVEGSTSSVALSVDPAAGTTGATARSAVGRVVLAGVLELRDVVAGAELTSRGDVHTAAATVTVGGAAVAGQPVGLTDQGVVALGQPVVPGQSVRDLTDQANAALTQAGITVRTIASTTRKDGRSAAAETGGIVLTLGTPDLPGGVAGNRLEVVVGGVSLTESDERAAPAPAPVAPPVASAVPSAPPAALPGIPGLPGTPGTPGTPGVPAVPGSLAQPAATAEVPQAAPSVLVAGRRIPAVAALAGFAAWQFLSLSTATLYALVDRRRRLALLAQEAA